ncbi:MAG: hypothetical protein RIB98_10060 [Acidimicrobiales bacterium]
MNNMVWINNRQPQTLYIAQFLLYFSAVSTLIFGGAGVGAISSGPTRFVVILLLTVGAAGGAFGIANERKWGYGLGIAAAIAPFVVRAAIWQQSGLGDAIEWNVFGLVFDVALLAALFHRMSGEYQRIYFR